MEDQKLVTEAAREAILLRFYNTFIIPLFNAAGYTLPTNMKISIGLMPTKRAIGVCFHPTVGSGYYHIYLSVEIAKNVYSVLETLIHEAIHTLFFDHKKDFSTCAARVGLLKPWKATVASDDLILKITRWIDDNEIGWYEPGLSLPEIRKQLKHQVGRNVKLKCPDCGYIIRTSRSNIDSKGYPLCPCFAEFKEA